MKQIELEYLKKKVDVDLKKQLISGRVLLDRYCMIDELSRKSPSYCDPNYAGFYYHLGKYISPNSLMEFGFDLGLFSACFMISCKTVKNYFAFRESDGSFFSERIGARNIRRSYKGNSKYHYGSIHDDIFDKVFENRWDMVIFSVEEKYDKQLQYFEFVWPYLNENAIMVCDNIRRNQATKDAFEAFAFSKNRESCFFNTRHGTMILQK